MDNSGVREVVKGVLRIVATLCRHYYACMPTSHWRMDRCTHTAPSAQSRRDCVSLCLCRDRKDRGSWKVQKTPATFRLQEETIRRCIKGGWCRLDDQIRRRESEKTLLDEPSSEFSNRNSSSFAIEDFYWENHGMYYNDYNEIAIIVLMILIQQ